MHAETGQSLTGRTLEFQYDTLGQYTQVLHGENTPRLHAGSAQKLSYLPTVYMYAVCSVPCYGAVT